MELYDSHTHTRNSPDSECDINDLCKRATEKNLKGITITDHCPIICYKEQDVFNAIKASANDVHLAKEKYKDTLSVLLGVEIGEGFWVPSYTKEILDAFAFDAVIGSVHAVRYKNLMKPYSQIDFKKISQDALVEYLSQYFEDILYMIENTDFDILAHLTCPLRYINGKYNLEMSCDRYLDKIELILKKMIGRRISMELNTSGIGTGFNCFMPDKTVLELYKKLGGSLITIGSDSHAAKTVGNGFEHALRLLKECGFSRYNYYKNRKAVFIDIAL